MLKTGTIYGINGPVIYLKGNTGFRMSEMVYVGSQKLVGEVIALDKDMTTVQVYEETTGLRPGEVVEASGNAVSVTLAPGILNNIFDGIERPLERIAESSGGAFITRGVSVDSLDRQKKWQTHLTVEKGQYLHGGDIIAEVPETHAIVHNLMINTVDERAALSPRDIVDLITSVPVRMAGDRSLKLLIHKIKRMELGICNGKINIGILEILPHSASLPPG